MHRPASFSVYTAPASEPITAAEAKVYCKCDGSYDDANFTLWIRQARESMENDSQTAMLAQTLEAQYDDWPKCGEEFWLPRPPLASVTHVKYYDTDGTEQTLSASVYEANILKRPGQVLLKPNQTWPALQSGKATPITIRYVAGYATTASIPADLLIGMYMRIASKYENRGDEVKGATSKTAHGSDVLVGRQACAWGY